MTIGNHLRTLRDPDEIGRFYERSHSDCAGLVAEQFINNRHTPIWVIEDIERRHPDNWIGKSARWKLGVIERTGLML